MREVLTTVTTQTSQTLHSPQDSLTLRDMLLIQPDFTWVSP
jgi:hypothetical protein